MGQSWGSCCLDTHINQAEIAALLLATCYAPELLEHEFVVHFVDNSAALAGLVKGHSCQWDSSVLLSVFGVQSASLRAHFWHEWVESPFKYCRRPKP